MTDSVTGWYDEFVGNGINDEYIAQNAAYDMADGIATNAGISGLSGTLVSDYYALAGGGDLIEILVALLSLL